MITRFCFAQLSIVRVAWKERYYVQRKVTHATSLPSYVTPR